MPAYGAISDQAPDALGYYKRERTCSFITQRVLLGITAVLFVVLGLTVIITAVILDVFLLSLWQNMFFAVFSFGICVIVAGATGSLAVHTRNKYALLLFAFFALGVFASSVTMIYFAFEESTSLTLPSIRENWAEDLTEKESNEKLCELQHDLNCHGWYPGCPTDAVAGQNQQQHDGDHLQSASTSSDSSEEAASHGTSLPPPGTSSSGNSSHSFPELSFNVTNSSYSFSISSGETVDDLRARLLCPVCHSFPDTNQTCLTAIRQRVDEATPIITGCSFGILILLAAMLAWSWKIRRKARKGNEEGELRDEEGSHPYKYL